MKRFTLVLSLTALAALGSPLSPLEAQGRGQGRGQGEQQQGERDSIPERYRPPAGMCRIWLKNVPPGQQPAPTDCASAVRNRPSNGRVIFGPQLPKSKTAPPPEKQPQRTEPPVPSRRIPPRRVPPS